jgi:AcrR family transcriptional regulator
MPVKRSMTPPPRVTVRLPPDARRQQLLDLTARLLTEQGAARFEIKELARIAGVTRPVVYRFFPTVLELIGAVLVDFERELASRFQRALVASAGRPLDEITAAFIGACCDAIEARGSGAWKLMYAKSSDREAAELGRASLARLLSPWMPLVAGLTQLPLPRARHLVEIVVAAGGAALDGWLDGRLRRSDAVSLATRVVTALLREFASPAGR